jgi:hypothetical protein
MFANAAHVMADKPGGVGRKQGIRTIDDLDGRTKRAKRVAELIGTFGAELTKSGRTLGATEIAAIRHAALMTALSEDAAARRLDGSTEVSLEDIVRLTRASQTAVRMLGIKPGAAPKPPSLPEYLASLAPQPAAVQPAQSAPEEPSSHEAHQRPRPEDGGASGA